MKKLIIFVTVLALVLTLSGCFGEPTPSTEPTTQPTTDPTTEPTTVPTEPAGPNAADILAAMEQATKEQPITAATMKMIMDYAFHVSTQGFEMDIGMALDATMEMLMSQDPYAGYAHVTAKITAMGMDMEESALSYLTMEDGVPVQYTHSISENSWTRSDAGAFDNNPSMDVAWLNEVDSLTMDEEPQVLNDRNAWVLRCELTMDQAAQLTGNINGSGDLMDSAGLEEDAAQYLKVQTVMYVDTETNLPMQMELTFLGLDEYLMDTMFDPSAAAPGQETSVEVNAFSLVLSDLSFEPQIIPPVPQVAYDYLALADHEPDQGDGTFLLINTDTAALITVPEGWEGYSIRYNMMEMNTSDFTFWAAFTLYEEQPDPGIKARFDGEVASYMQNNMYAAHGRDTIGDFQVGWIEDIYGCKHYYAWAPMGPGWLYITTEDFEGVDMHELLDPLLQAAQYQDPNA